MLDHVKPVRPGLSMPLKGKRNREYMREYMRRKRAAEHTEGKPKQTGKPASPDNSAELAQARARIAELERELIQRAGQLPRPHRVTTRMTGSPNLRRRYVA